MIIIERECIDQRLEQQMEEYKLDLIQDLVYLLKAYQNNDLNGNFYVRVGEKVMELDEKRKFSLVLAVLNRPVVVYKNGQFYTAVRDEGRICFIPYFLSEIS